MQTDLVYFYDIQWRSTGVGVGCLSTPVNLVLASYVWVMSVQVVSHAIQLHEEVFVCACA